MNNYHIHFNISTLNFGAGTISKHTDISRIVTDAFIVPDEQREPLIELLVTALAPARIYKVEHKDIASQQVSYIDLLIVIPQTCRTPFIELEPVLEMAHLKDQRISCSLHQEHSVADGLQSGHVFYNQFFSDKNLVYDDGTIVFPPLDKEMWGKMTERMRNQFTFFQEKARCFYESALALNQKYTPPIIAFMLHQAVELTYRGILENLNGYGKKTHDIRSLRKQTRRCAPQLGDVFPDNTTEEQRLVSLLDNAYLSSRYDANYTISAADANTLIGRVKLFLEATEAVFEAALAE